MLKKIKGLGRYCLALSVCINLGLLAVMLTPLAVQLYNPLIINEKPRKSEVIVILSAGIYDTELPSFRTLVRLRKGLTLYQGKWAENIICAGGVRTKTGKSVAEAMKETLVSYGIPESNIFLQDETTNTFKDITFLIKKYENRFNFQNAIFVTSSYHTYRTRKILDKKNIQAIVVSADPYELHPILKTERLELFREGVREYLAIIYSRMKGWI